MKLQLRNSLVIMAIATSIVGCGGSALLASTNVAGTWIESPNSANTTITISGDGVVNGRSNNFSLGGSNVLTGRVNSDGSFFGKVENDLDASYSYTVRGTMKFGNSTNRLMVNYSGSYSSTQVTTDVLLTRSGTQ